jgi:hypothetical protein
MKVQEFSPRGNAKTTGIAYIAMSHHSKESQKHGGTSTWSTLLLKVTFPTLGNHEYLQSHRPTLAVLGPAILWPSLSPFLAIFHGKTQQLCRWHWILLGGTTTPFPFLILMWKSSWPHSSWLSYWTWPCHDLILLDLYWFNYSEMSGSSLLSACERCWYFGCTWWVFQGKITTWVAVLFLYFFPRIPIPGSVGLYLALDNAIHDLGCLFFGVFCLFIFWRQSLTMALNSGSSCLSLPSAGILAM